jgi:HEAT repeat protein
VFLFFLRLVFSAAALAIVSWAQEADEKQRIRQVRELAEQGPSGLPKLAEFLRDPSIAVREEAVASITAIGGRESLDLLIEATRDSAPQVQMRAADGLVNYYLPGYVQRGRLQRFSSAVRSRFSSSNDQVIPAYVSVRPDVIAALGRLARGGSSMESRANAARALGILRGRAALDDLVAALRSKDDLVIYEALIALQKIKDPAAGDSVVFLLRDLSEKVRLAAIETAGVLQARAALPELRRIFQDPNSSTRLRRAAISALALIPDEANRPVLEAGLQDKDDRIRGSAAEGLGRLKNKNDLPRLEQMFEQEKKMHARLGAAFAVTALGRYEISEFSPAQYLINTLNSRAYRGVAEPYLTELARDPAFRTALHQALAKGTKEEKIGLSRVLAASGGPDSLAVLDQLSKDPDPEVAQAALDAGRTLRARLQ